MTARSSRRSRSTAASRRDGRLPRNAALAAAADHPGGRGDGVGRASYTHQYRTAEHHVLCRPLAGEEVIAQPLSLGGQGIRRLPQEILTPSAERREPTATLFPPVAAAPSSIAMIRRLPGKRPSWTGFWHVPVWHPPPALMRIFRRGEPAPRHLPYQTPCRRCGGRLSGTRLQPYCHPGGCSVAHGTGPHAVCLAEMAEHCFPAGLTIDAAANCLDNGICLLLRGPEGWHDGLLEMLATWADDTGLARLSVAIAGGDRRGCGPDDLCPGAADIVFGGIATPCRPADSCRPPSRRKR